MKAAGVIVMTALTNGWGRYNVNLAGGNWDAEASKAGYITANSNLTVTGPISPGQGADLNLSKVLLEGQYRVLLTNPTWSACDQAGDAKITALVGLHRNAETMATTVSGGPIKHFNECLDYATGGSAYVYMYTCHNGNNQSCSSMVWPWRPFMTTSVWTTPSTAYNCLHVYLPKWQQSEMVLRRGGVEDRA